MNPAGRLTDSPNGVVSARSQGPPWTEVSMRHNATSAVIRERSCPSGVPPADIRYDDGVLTITGMECSKGLVLAGEIDESTYPALVRALENVAAENQTIHLDLSGL